MVLEKTLESPLDCKEIQPVHSKGAIVNGASIAVISFILLFDHGNAINF